MNLNHILVLISMVLFAAVGWWLGNRKNRNGLVWGTVGAVFPPTLLILLFLKTAEAEEEEDEGELSEG
jgi:hypothetical protein